MSVGLSQKLLPLESWVSSRLLGFPRPEQCLLLSPKEATAVLQQFYTLKVDKLSGPQKTPAAAPFCYMGSPQAGQHWSGRVAPNG